MVQILDIDLQRTLLPHLLALTDARKTGQIPVRESTKTAGNPEALADVFISYASEDRARIEPLVGEIEGAGYSVWWDQELKGGSRFSDRIEQEIVEAAAVLVVWSPNAARSRWVADEADLALETGNLLPISLDGSRAPMGFRQHQTIDFSGWSGGGAPCVAALLDALREHGQTSARTPNQPVALPQSNEVKSDASIAVLPFVNMSSDPDYFSDGISEELLNLLAKVKELRVIARTSSFSFKGTDKPIEEIAALLKVAYILEGSVRKAGNRVRITAQLIETRKSFHLWSETYDRELDDIFAIQDEISAAIVGALKDHILGGETMVAPESTKSATVGAYEHYVLGQQFQSTRSSVDIETGKQHFEEALALDPDYVPAMVGLADAMMYLSDALFCYGSTPVKEACSAALPLVTRALELDPSSSEAHGVMNLYHDLKQDYVKARKSAEESIRLNPNSARSYNRLIRAMALSGDPKAPIFSTLRLALERDPVSRPTIMNVYYQHYLRLNFHKAAPLLRQLEAAQPTFLEMLFRKSELEYFQGEWAKGLARLLDPETAFANSKFTYGTQYTATLLGHGALFESHDPSTALEGYLETGNMEAVRRVGRQVEAQDSAGDDYPTTLRLAGWKGCEGLYQEALDLLSPFDDPDPDGWGQNFGAGSHYSGATLSLYLLQKLGKSESAALTLEKLKVLHQTLVADPDGILYAADYIAAVIAMAEGDKEAALGALECQIGRTMFTAGSILRHLAFQELHGEPRYQALLEKYETFLAGEKAKAEAAGLLPVPEELMARLKEE